jgi:nucleotide-binding universal stress UspA family protein
MRILVAVDQNPYSAHAVRQVAGLAMNTWADITLLGLQPKKRTGANPSASISGRREIDPALCSVMTAYRDTFLSHFEDEASPYTQLKFEYELLQTEPNIWQEFYVGRSSRKDFNVSIRQGNPTKEILAEAGQDGSDLIVLGCERDPACFWEEWGNVPQKVAASAACSVWVIKKEKDIKKILCCLDNDRVSQESLEMIGQMVTLYGAELEIVGLTQGDSLPKNVEQKLDAILKYYTAQKIRPWIELVKISSLESFISQEGRWGLLALWMGEKSILQKAFSRKTVDRLIRAGESSVLILK